MPSFKDMLKADESLIRDDIPLSYDYIPKILKYREKEQRQFASAIKPLLQERSGRNLFVYGAPGIGKTAACRHVLRELEEETDVIPLYLNCWKYNTAFKMVSELCRQLGIQFIANQKTSELFSRAVSILNKKSAVFVFDEIDKLEDFDMLYMVLEDIYKKAIFLITNYKERVQQLDERIMSRLTPELVEFLPYNKEETHGILHERMKYAFVPGVWDSQAFSAVVEKTCSWNDIRRGLFMMREAATLAEEKAMRQITMDEVKRAAAKVDELAFNQAAQLDDELKAILNLVKENPSQKIGDVFQLFLKNGAEMSYRNFTRKIEKLEQGKFILTEKLLNKDGNTTLIHIYSEKKLTDY